MNNRDVDLDGTELELRAIEVFGNKEKAVAWLQLPIPGLDGKRPGDVIGTPEGRQEVEDILGRIEHGVFG